MTNEQILNNHWKNIDKYLSNYLKEYKNVNQTMRDKLQTVFDSIDITYSDINKPISKSQKNRLDRFILDLKKKGLLTGYFGYMARLVYNKKNVTYSEMIEIMIMGSYIEQNKTLDEYNNVLFLNTCKDSYEKGIEDIAKTKDIKPISFKIPILYTLLNIPILNATAESYLYSLALTNADELYKQTLINMQLGKGLDVDSKYYKDLFNKQDNRLININGDKLSGGIVNIVENLSNLAYLQAGIDTNTTECRFIAEIDKRTTDMCETLNNQIFKLNEMNVYQRYSDLDQRIVTYHTKGLVQGENLPPINNHFHYCRSTITYQVDMPRDTLNKNLMVWNEQNALFKYLGGKSIIINEKMRNNQKLTKEEQQYKKNLYRALNKVPYYEGNIVRVVDIRNQKLLTEFLDEYKIANTVEFRQFTSFSNKTGYNDNANINIWVQDSKKARNVISYSQESEVLYQYGTKFKVLNVVEKDAKYFILLEEIDE